MNGHDQNAMLILILILILIHRLERKARRLARAIAWLVSESVLSPILQFSFPAAFWALRSVWSLATKAGVIASTEKKEKIYLVQRVSSPWFNPTSKWLET